MGHLGLHEDKSTVDILESSWKEGDEWGCCDTCMQQAQKGSQTAVYLKQQRKNLVVKSHFLPEGFMCYYRIPVEWIPGLIWGLVALCYYLPVELVTDTALDRAFSVAARAWNVAVAGNLTKLYGGTTNYSTCHLLLFVIHHQLAWSRL